MFSGTTAFFTSVARQMPSAVVLCFLGMMRIVYAQEDARVITTVAGSGTYGFAGDGGPALEARIAAWGIAVDGNGNIYMSDPENSRVRKIDGQTGIISTSAGNGGQNFGGVDLAINRSLLQPHGLHVDGAGNLYIADRGTAVVRKVDAVTGLMRAVAGSEFGEGFDGDGGLSGEARFNGLQDVAVDGAGNLYIADTFNHRIRRVDAETDIVTTIAGNGIEGFSGDGGPGAEASLSMPQGVSVDSFGNVYVADSNNRRIRRIDGDTGVITTVAGNGFSGFSGDGGQATSAMLNGPVDVFVAGSGRGFIADFAGGEIRAAMFAGQIYISDTFNHRIRRVDEAGIITTVAGSSSSGFSGDGGQAVRARLTTPSQIAVDETGNIYMVDGDSRIRKVEGDPLARVAEGGGLEMSVDALHFGELLVGDEATKVLALTNRNNQPIQLTLTLSGSDAFGMETGEVALSPGGRMSVALVFAPLIGGEYTGELSIALEGAEDQQVTVPLTGTGSAVPRLVLRREEIRFVDVVAEDQVVEVLLIENESTFGADLALTLEGDPAFVAPRELLLPAKGSGRVLLTFAPPALGSYEGVLNIGRVGEDEVLLSVTLRGQGVEPSRIGFIGDKELVTVAGGFTGDGGPATEAFLIAPQDLDMDEKGNVYVAEGRRIRVIDSAGNITTLVEAQSTIISLEVDGMGNVFFSSGGLIHKRDQSGTVTVVAGTLTFNRDTDNVRATEAFLGGTDAPLKIAVDEAGNIYIASGRDIWCWKVEAATGLIKVLVGNAGRGDSGDGGPASEAQINLAKDVAVDRVGNVYIADHNSHRVRRVDAITGIISTVAGTGASGSGGDGGPAVSAMLNFPRSLHVDGSDDLYIIDQVGIRRVDAAGSLSNLLEMHSFGFAGDGGPASEAAFNFSAAVLADGEGEIYIADTGNDRLRKVDSAGIISTVVGGGLDDGVQATKTMLNAPNDVAVDAAGNIYIADTGNNLIRKVDATTGIITSVAGGGNASYPDYGDGGPATEAVLNSPQGIFVDGDGVLYIADTNNRKIRKVDGDGRISTVAGNPDAGVSLGDGGPAIGAKLSPTDVIVDGDGNIYIVDTFNFRIRKVDPAGTITTIAGNGDFKESGYGGAAIDAGLARPTGLFVDGAGNLFIASASGGLSKVDGTGTISKVVSDFSGLANIDGNGTGDLYVSQPFNSLASKSVMVVSQTGIVETMAQGFINPQGVFYDRQNDRLYIADAGDGRIVRLDNLDPIVLGLASMEEATAEDEEVQEATGSFQRTQLWELARVANLGPRAGNGVDATDVVVDRRRNRAFVGNIDNISVVNLQLGTVTGVIGRDAMGTFFNDERRYLGINGRRDELYVLSNGEYLQVLDLGSQLRKNQIDLGNTMRNDRSDHLRKLLVDEEGNRLYVVARQSFRGTAVGNFSAKNGLAVDLVDGRVIGEIQLNGTMDIALSPDGRVLYAANGADRQIDLVDIGTLQITGSISLQLIPQAILADPRGSYLYAVVIEEINSNAKLIRIDLRTNTVTGEIEMGDLYILPLMVIEQGTRIMWLTGGDGGAGFLPGTSHSKVDLENFRLLTGDLVTEGFFPTVLSAMTINPIDRELVMTGRQSNLTLTANLDNGAIRDQIEIGAQPVGVAVSERLNQVYIARGEHGGFFVFDGQGDLLNTVEGELIGFAGGRVIVVDDVSDRLFVNEGLAVSTYELSSLRLLNRALIAQRGEIVLPATGLRLDHDRGILWVVAADFLIELDLLTGAEISRTRFPESDRLGNMILLPDSNKAYASYHDFAANDKIKAGLLRVFDRSTRSVTKIIDIAAHIPAIFDQGRVIPELLGVDIERKRLYVWINTNNTKIAAIDIEKDEVVEVLDVEIERVDFNLLLDSVNDKIFYSSGLIFDIETGAQERFASTQSDGGLIAHNRVTNTIYVVGKEGMNIFLGPAGTETPPPPAPAEAAATPGDEEVVLTWTAVEDPALVGYHVYRSQDTGFVRITRTPLTKTSFTDIDLVNGQTYSYQVSSLGQNALESLGRTAPVAAVPTSGGNFRLLVLRKNVAVARGDSVSLPMSIESLEAFDEEVTLSAQSAEGIEVLFNPSTLAPPKIVEVVVKAAEGASLGRFEVTLGGKGGDKEQEAGLVVEVTAKVLEQSALTLELDQEETPLDIALLVGGRLFPGVSSQIQLDFAGVRSDTLITRTVDTDVEGGYQVEFLAPFTDRWQVTATWAGNADFEAAASRTVEFAVSSGKSRITATSDLADDADLSFIATIKGRIHPSPGTVGVTLTVRRPDRSEEQIDGIQTSEAGFYGHDVRMDQAGIWEVWASWKGNDRLLGATSPVITIPVQTDVGRVILLAGGRDSAGDTFWPTSNYLGNLAYKTFQRRRLVKEKIFYLNDRQEQDVDRDGFQEDVDEGATMNAWSDAWNWARERVQSDSPLYVYLVGKGQPTGLEIGDGEILTATQLLQDLSVLEGATGAQATLIVDASHAGHFIRDLSDQGRHVIASTGLGPAFYQAEGYLSFSQYFLTDLFQGKSVQEAFLHTDQILRNLPGAFRQQDPGLEAEGNLIPNQPGDYLQTLDAIIGAPFELGDLSPQIKASSLSSVAGGAGKQVVTQTAPVSEDPGGPRLKLAKRLAEQGVEISARIDDPEGSLAVVRAMIIPPESSEEELTGYPEVTLEADGTGRWVGVSHEFLEEGVYPVIIYAIDGAGNAAEPLRTTVLVEPPPPLPTGDFNGDGLVDFADFFLFADAFGSENPAYDLDQSGMVDFGDFFLFADAFGGPLGKLLALAEEMLVLPTEYALRAPYPNPFNSEVVVKYSLPREGEVELVVYNALGQVVRRLATGHQGMGHHRVVWDGRDDAGRGLATGTYLVQLRAGEWGSDASRPADLRFNQVRKVAFVK